MVWDCENFPALLEEEDTQRHVEVGIAGLLVVVEYANPILRSAQDTPPLLPGLRKGRREGGREEERREGGRKEGKREGGGGRKEGRREGRGSESHCCTDW